MRCSARPPSAAAAAAADSQLPPHDSCALGAGSNCALLGGLLCRYSPNLSRRCTHLAVPGGVNVRSEKLHSALRNRHKWGLHIVDLR